MKQLRFDFVGRWPARGERRTGTKPNAEHPNNGISLGFACALWQGAVTPRLLAKMHPAIRGMDGRLAHGDTFHNNRCLDLKADFILANPPFNVSDWSGERLRDDKRWKYSVPPVGNANLAWVQPIIPYLPFMGSCDQEREAVRG